VLPKNFVSAKLLVPLMEDMHALPVSVMFTPSVVNCAKMQAFFITQPVFHVLLDTNGLLKALTTSRIMLASLQLLIDKKCLHIV
jgi:hypothetical protein